jgi:SET and MYND domain-containing protein 4
LKALCYAESNDQISLAYSNRSSVYLELKKYDECLLSIKWARENGYKNEQKLKNREEKCKKLMEDEVKDPKDDPWLYFQLSYPANPQIPFIVDCLEIKKSKKFGRGIYTTRDLNVGDIIAIEPPITTRMFPPVDIEFIHCCNCLKACQANLIPCTKTSNFMFCSVECREFIYKKFPDLGMVNLLGDLFNYEKFYADIVDKFGGHRNLLEFVQQNDIKKFDKSVFDFDLSDPNDPEYGLNMIMCMLSFKGSHELCGIPEMIAGRAPPTSVTKGNEQLYRFMAHALTIMDLNAKCIAYGSIGTAFGNLLNHSCVPNVSRVQLDSKVLLYVLKPVKAGEQLFDSYYMEGE